MVKNLFLVTTMVTALFASSLDLQNLPEGFSYLQGIDPRIRQFVRYASMDNFIGRPLVGYEKPIIILSTKAALALKTVQDRVEKDGYDLVVYDGYRPQRTVDSFTPWARDLVDQGMKEKYYPHIDKKDVHALGYIAEKSQHSRGSAVDVTLIQKEESLHSSLPSTRILRSGVTITFLDDGTVDMGAHFDLFDEASWHDTSLVTNEQTRLRNYLRSVMVEAGFEPYAKEWWHYSLKDEPFPETYFDFTIT